MTQPAYTDADVQLIEAAWDEHRTAFFDGLIAECRCGSREDNHDEKVALAALVAAGRLLPAGTETRTEWATRIKAHGEYAEELLVAFANSVMTEEERARQRAVVYRRRFGAELVDVMRSEIHTTPWTVAEEPA